MGKVGSGQGNLDTQTIDDLKFMLGNNRRDMEMIKKVFTPSKLALILELEEKMKRVEYELNVLQAASEASAKNSAITELK